MSGNKAQRDPSPWRVIFSSCIVTPMTLHVVFSFVGRFLHCQTSRRCCKNPIQLGTELTHPPLDLTTSNFINSSTTRQLPCLDGFTSFIHNLKHNRAAHDGARNACHLLLLVLYLFPTESASKDLTTFPTSTETLGVALNMPIPTRPMEKKPNEKRYRKRAAKTA